MVASMSGGFAGVLTVACAVGAGLVGGVYFAFSTFVMRGLRDLPAPAGMAAMQSINRAAPTPLFVVALVGTAGGCVVLGVLAAARWDDPAAPWTLAGAALHVASFVLTVAYHVPRNEALGRLDPEGAAVARWPEYLAAWVPANHVRTAASLAGAVALTVAVSR
jgi:uncharacterized membrane protein